MISHEANHSPLEIYGKLMARALAHRKTAKHKTGKRLRVEKGSGPKAASKVSRRNSISKGKKSLGTGKQKRPIKAKKEAVRQTHPRRKGKVHMEAESRKSALKAGATSAIDTSTRLLRQTKTTSAALALLQKGIELIFEKEFRKARTELQSLLETFPGELEILARARSYIQICDREEANLRKQPISSDQLYARGIMEHNKANYDAAINYFLQSLEKHPDADYIYYSVAASQAMKGDLAQSIENLRKAVELNEDSRIYAKNDADFSALQAKKEFAELVGINQPPPPEPQ
jgi:tetratricopeptide (TPR) repeat protein